MRERDEGRRKRRRVHSYHAQTSSSYIKLYRYGLLCSLVVGMIQTDRVDKRARSTVSRRVAVYFLDFFGNNTEWMFGKTPPAAMVTVPRSLESSSSLRIAN